MASLRTIPLVAGVILLCSAFVIWQGACGSTNPPAPVGADPPEGSVKPSDLGVMAADQPAGGREGPVSGTYKGPAKDNGVGKRSLPAILALLLDKPAVPPECIDLDGDGYGDPASSGCAHAQLDCDDSSSIVYPDAPELCEGIDNQCPGDVGYGVVDEGCGMVSTLPDTGISQCYGGSGVIACPTAGQAYYGQDAQVLINPMSYEDNGDGTVTDNVTGLLWQQCSAGLTGADCSGGALETKSWADAIAYCETRDLGGHTDWHLPDQGELQSILDYGRSWPAIHPTFFPGTQSSTYWSSSPDAEHADRAWSSAFAFGTVSYAGKAGLCYVRCVRGETNPRALTDNGDGTVTDRVTGLMWQQQDDGVRRTWAEALAHCQALELPEGQDGYSDWRLPDVKELRSIVDDTTYDPAIDTTLFPGTGFDYAYWTSSSMTYSVFGDHAWRLLFTDGHVWYSAKASPYYVRCVR